MQAAVNYVNDSSFLLIVFLAKKTLKKEKCVKIKGFF